MLDTPHRPSYVHGRRRGSARCPTLVGVDAARPATANPICTRAGSLPAHPFPTVPQARHGTLVWRRRPCRVTDCWMRLSLTQRGQSRDHPEVTLNPYETIAQAILGKDQESGQRASVPQGWKARAAIWRNEWQVFIEVTTCKLSCRKFQCRLEPAATSPTRSFHCGRRMNMVGGYLSRSMHRRSYSRMRATISPLARASGLDESLTMLATPGRMRTLLTPSTMRLVF